MTTIDGIDLPHFAVFCFFRDRVTVYSQLFLPGKSRQIEAEYLEFSYQDKTYLIQVENNKGWDYISLWRTAPDSTCLLRVFFDGIDGVSEEEIRELLDQPFYDEHTVREILQSPEIEWRNPVWNGP